MLGFLRSKRIKRAFINNKRKHTFRSLEAVKSVLILFQTKDYLEVLKVASDLSKQGKKVSLWTVDSSNFPFPKDEKLPDISIKVLKKEDFSSLKILNAKIETEYSALEYDTLIDFTNSNKGVELDYFTYLLAINKSEFCIGCQKIDVKDVYDLIVLREKDQKISELFDEMKLFLHNIKS